MCSPPALIDPILLAGARILALLDGA